MMKPTTPKTKCELLAAFGHRSTVTMEVRTDDGPMTLTGTICLLGHEDGSGESFYGKFYDTEGEGRLVDCYFGRFK